MVDGAEIDADGGAFDFGGVVAPPAEGGVVVMRAGVDDRVRHVAVRQIEMPAAIGEAELQDAHAGHAEMLAQLVDFGRDEAKVFGDEGEVAEDFVEASEERMAGSFDPVAIDGGFFLGGDGPVGFKAAEVVEADGVVERERAADAGDPPVEAASWRSTPSDRADCPSAARSRRSNRGARRKRGSGLR